MSSITSTPPGTRQSRHSLVVLASNLRPSRQKLNKYFGRSRHSVPESTFETWRMSLQLGALGNPQLPLSSDTRHGRSLDDGDHRGNRLSADNLCSGALPSAVTSARTSPPSPPRPQRAAPAIPSPEQIPPVVSPLDSSPSQTPLSAVSTLTSLQDQMPPSLRISSAASTSSDQSSMYSAFSPPSRPKSRIRRAPSHNGPRRRAKTPVHRIGDLEMAAAQGRREAVLSREGSVRTIARQYRALVDETHIPDVPRVPTIHRKPVRSASPSSQDIFYLEYGPMPRESVVIPRGAGLLQAPRPRCELPASDEATYYGGQAPPTPPLDKESEQEQEQDHGQPRPAADTGPSQIGVDLLVKGLLAAHHSGGSARSRDDLSGLQNGLTGEARERLRNQLDTMEGDDAKLGAMFDSLHAALTTVQSSLANEAAESESEYEDDLVQDDDDFS